MSVLPKNKLPKNPSIFNLMQAHPDDLKQYIENDNDLNVQNIRKMFMSNKNMDMLQKKIINYVKLNGYSIPMQNIIHLKEVMNQKFQELLSQYNGENNTKSIINYLNNHITKIIGDHIVSNIKSNLSFTNNIDKNIFIDRPKATSTKKSIVLPGFQF